MGRAHFSEQSITCLLSKGALDKRAPESELLVSRTVWSLDCPRSPMVPVRPHWTQLTACKLGKLLRQAAKIHTRAVSASL